MSTGGATGAVEESFGIIGMEMKKKYKGVRRRRWGKWVSEIRVPGTQERLWLGSYSTPEAAAIAHDIAFFCLRRPSSLDVLNFPSMSMLPPSLINIIKNINDVHHANIHNMSPKCIQKAASDAGMAVDAHMIIMLNSSNSSPNSIINFDHKASENMTRSYGNYETTTTSVFVETDDQWWERKNESSGSSMERNDADQPLSISVDDYL